MLTKNAFISIIDKATLSAERDLNNPDENANYLAIATLITELEWDEIPDSPQLREVISIMTANLIEDAKRDKEERERLDIRCYGRG